MSNLALLNFVQEDFILSTIFALFCEYRFYWQFLSWITFFGTMIDQRIFSGVSVGRQEIPSNDEKSQETSMGTYCGCFTTLLRVTLVLQALSHCGVSKQFYVSRKHTLSRPLQPSLWFIDSEGVWFKGWRESSTPRLWLSSGSFGQPISFPTLLTFF